MPGSQQDKPFRIPKMAVWQAYEKVKRNQGAPGGGRAVPRGDKTIFGSIPWELIVKAVEAVTTEGGLLLC